MDRVRIDSGMGWCGTERRRGRDTRPRPMVKLSYLMVLGVLLHRTCSGAGTRTLPFVAFMQRPLRTKRLFRSPSTFQSQTGPRNAGGSGPCANPATFIFRNALIWVDRPNMGMMGGDLSGKALGLAGVILDHAGWIPGSGTCRARNLRMNPRRRRAVR